jgi:uncharacterized protein YbjT (DUF2867 family)
MDKAREIAEGALMFDAAMAVGVKLFVLSSEPSVTTLSNGKRAKVWHVDSKAEVSDHARLSGIPVVDVHVAVCMNNSATFFKPQPAGDGTFVVGSAWSLDLMMPLIDILYDAGLFVRLAVESGEFNQGGGKIISAYGEWLTVGDQIRILCETSGKAVSYVQLTDEELRVGMELQGMPSNAIDDISELFRFDEELCEKTYIHSNRDTLARLPRTFTEFCETQI